VQRENYERDTLYDINLYNLMSENCDLLCNALPSTAFEKLQEQQELLLEISPSTTHISREIPGVLNSWIKFAELRRKVHAMQNASYQLAVGIFS